MKIAIQENLVRLGPTLDSGRRAEPASNLSGAWRFETVQEGGFPPPGCPTHVQPLPGTPTALPWSPPNVTRALPGPDPRWLWTKPPTHLFVDPPKEVATSLYPLLRTLSAPPGLRTWCHSSDAHQPKVEGAQTLSDSTRPAPSQPPTAPNPLLLGPRQIPSRRRRLRPCRPPR